MTHLTPLRTLLLALLLQGGAGGVFADVQDLGVTEQVAASVVGDLGAAAGTRLAAWQDLVRDHAQDPVEGKLAQVNAFFNDNMAQAADQAQWNQQDYWMTPLQFVARGAGDSEDSAIAKFYTLLALDIPEEQLRIAYTRATLNAETFAHMVLLYRPAPGQTPLVLDNIENPVRPLTERSELRVVYEFNQGGLFVPRADGEQRVGEVSRLSAWNDMLTRKSAGAW